VDFIDIIASEKENRISVIFSEEYINEEAVDNFELKDVEIDIETKLSDEDFNQLI
jgi:hypothetical protein